MRAGERGRPVRRSRRAREPRVLDARLPGVGAERVSSRGRPAAASPVPVSNGSPASPEARLSAGLANGRARRAVRFGRGAAVRVGLADPAGRPISAAALQVLTREVRSGSEWRLAPAVTTGADGRVLVAWPPGRPAGCGSSTGCASATCGPWPPPRCGWTCAPA